MVKRKEYEGTLETVTQQTTTITGLISEDSTINIANMIELSILFLNSVYDTLIEAGYTDTIKNEEDFSITVLGFKFYLTIGNSMIPITAYIGANSIYGNGGAISKLVDKKYHYKYNIIVRGDQNLVSICYGSYDNYTTNYQLFLIAKAKNLITQENAFLCTPYSFGASVAASTRIINENHNYQVISGTINSNNSNSLLSIPNTYAGLNTNTKFVCEPQLANSGTYLIHSMIRGNSAIFTRGCYYKIGSEIYYCDNAYNGSGIWLYKVS